MFEKAWGTKDKRRINLLFEAKFAGSKLSSDGYSYFSPINMMFIQI